MKSQLLFILILFFISFNSFTQKVEDDFEGNGTITTWYKDDCNMDTSFANPYKESINTSNTVLKYEDIGGLYANIAFNTSVNFDLSTNYTFTFKIYIASNSVTGNQTNQISLKLQDGNIGSPWSTQSEIIKILEVDKWQEVTFDFKNDAYINLDSNSVPPTQRTDFNRVLFQINGENNTYKVIGYIDDFSYDGTLPVDTTPVYNNLVWSDEFDGNGAVNTENWYHQTKLIAGDSWANNEQQHYTNRQANSYLDNGTLKIKAIRESYSDQGHQKEYTSARLNSKFAFKYGKVEVRAKLPSIAGTWPAIWLLGKNIDEDGTYWDNEGFGTASWPWCGEIDIMEPNVPKTEILATWHWNNGAGYTYNSKSITTNNTDTSQNFHLYTLVWSPDSMKIYMDNILINEMQTVDPFNQEYFILLNLAMGGNLGGAIDSNFNNDILEIDYVRVYQESQLSINSVDKEKALVYPNPIKDYLSIKINDNKKLKNVEVFNVNGKSVFKSNNSTFSLSKLKNGIYFLKVNTLDGDSFFKKIIKE